MLKSMKPLLRHTSNLYVPDMQNKRNHLENRHSLVFIKSDARQRAHHDAKLPRVVHGLKRETIRLVQVVVRCGIFRQQQRGFMQASEAHFDSYHKSKPSNSGSRLPISW